MRWKTIRAASMISMVALASEVAAAGSNADAAKINTILDRWQVVEATKGGDVVLWRDMMGIQLKMATPSTLDKLLALNSGDSAQSAAQLYQTFINTLGADIAQRLQAKREAKAQAQSGSETKSLGSAGIDQTFTPITPCRVVDTRNVGGKIAAFATHNFYYYTVIGSYDWGVAQGGVSGAASTVCPGTFFPYPPSGAVATVIVTGQGGAGNLIVWQGTNPLAPADTLSYPASGDTSTLADIPWGARTGTGPGGGVLDFGVYVNAFTSTNVVVDVVGYYSQPAATPLSCVSSSNNGVGTGDWATGTRFVLTLPACAAGYTLTGSGCSTQSFLPANAYLQEISPASFGDCYWFNNTGGALNSTALRAESVCCRVPGH